MSRITIVFILLFVSFYGFSQKIKDDRHLLKITGSSEKVYKLYGHNFTDTKAYVKHKNLINGKKGEFILIYSVENKSKIELNVINDENRIGKIVLKYDSKSGKFSYKGNSHVTEKSLSTKDKMLAGLLFWLNLEN